MKYSRWEILIVRLLLTTVFAGQGQDTDRENIIRPAGGYIQDLSGEVLLKIYKF